MLSSSAGVWMTMKKMKIVVAVYVAVAFFCARHISSAIQSCILCIPSDSLFLRAVRWFPRIHGCIAREVEGKRLASRVEATQSPRTGKNSVISHSLSIFPTSKAGGRITAMLMYACMMEEDKNIGRATCLILPDYFCWFVSCHTVRIQRTLGF